MNYELINKLFNTIFAELPLAIAVFTVEGIYVSANNIFLNRCGYSNEQLTTINLFTLINITSDSINNCEKRKINQGIYSIDDELSPFFASMEYLTECVLQSNCNKIIPIIITKQIIEIQNVATEFFIVIDISYFKSYEINLLEKYQEIQAAYEEIAIPKFFKYYHNPGDGSFDYQFKKGIQKFCKIKNQTINLIK